MVGKYTGNGTVLTVDDRPTVPLENKIIDDFGWTPELQQDYKYGAIAIYHKGKYRGLLHTARDQLFVTDSGDDHYGKTQRTSGGGTPPDQDHYPM